MLCDYISLLQNKDKAHNGCHRQYTMLKPHYKQLREILRDNPLDIVEVYCPLEICRQRNIARGDRYEDQSREQQELMSGEIVYSLRVDTSRYTARECAEMILNTLFAK